MKIAWLVWDDLDSKEAGDKPEFWTQYPGEWRVFVQIVYAEVIVQ